MQYRYFSEENDPYGEPEWDTAHPEWHETIEHFETHKGVLYDWNAGKSRKQPSRRLIEAGTATVVRYDWHKSLGKKAKALLEAAPVTQRVPE